MDCDLLIKQVTISQARATNQDAIQECTAFLVGYNLARIPLLSRTLK